MILFYHTECYKFTCVSFSYNVRSAVLSALENCYSNYDMHFCASKCFTVEFGFVYVKSSVHFCLYVFKTTFKLVFTVIVRIFQ